MACRFSKDGKYFGQLSNDGKLKIWHTVSNKFIQEFTPDVHLTTPCTCLHFIQSKIGSVKNGSPRKKVKRRNSMIEDTYTIALGTTSGTILLYSVDNADILDTISSETNYNITCITYQRGVLLYTGAEKYILQWNLADKVIKQKWKSGNEEITAILEIPAVNRLLTAARLIKLWDIETKQLLKSFTGHSSEITTMDYATPHEGQSYVISGSKSDRTLSCWNLFEDTKNENAVATFLLEDTARSVHITSTAEGVMYVAVTVANGAIHIFEHTLNGKCTKPLKPKTTVKIAATCPDKNGQVKPIPVVAGYLLANSIILTYGTAVFLTFESIALDLTERSHCLIRTDSGSIESRRKDRKSDSKISHVVEPVIDNVTYLTPHTSTNKAVKRQKDGGNEIAMEKRLENLTVAASAFNTSTTSTVSGTPQTNNVAQLLVQGLHSEDKEILRTVLCRQIYKDQVVINTVRRLKMPVIQLLIAELVKMLQNRTTNSQAGAIWLKHILHCHSGLLLANPELADLLSPALNAIQSRLTLAQPLQRLQGRLDLIMSQIKNKGKPTGGGEVDRDEETLMVYDDKALSDDELAGMEMAGPGSDSDMDEWNEDDDNSNGDDDDDDDDDDSKKDDNDAMDVAENSQSADESEVEIIEDEDNSS